MLEQKVFAAIEDLLCATDVSDVTSIFKNATAELGALAFIICEVPPECPPGTREIYASGWNTQWQQKYLSENYAKYDPVPNAVHMKSNPYFWSEAEKLSQRNLMAKRIMNEARNEFGMNSGYCVPIHGLMGVSGLVSLASTEKDWRLSDKEQAGLHITSLYAYEAIRKLRHRAPTGGGPKLSPREIECVKWVAVGKTSWEISKIFGISEETVSEHIQNASRKLGTCSRAHLVARAHRLRIIC